MRKALALSLIITVLAVVAYFTKPSEEACITKARQEFEEKKLAYAGQTLPKGVNIDIFKETAAKNFLESLKVTDQVVLKAIYQQTGSSKKRIGWGAFGFVSVDVN